jgi:dTDP-4-amino-4,6-dideoxygalactose transaminase
MSSDAKHIAYALPDVDGSELEEIKEVLASGWLTTGPRVKKFEAEFAQAVGAKHGIAVNSCTAALHLALEAVGTSRGDEVVTTPYTFAATAAVVRYFDARPVFVDVEEDSLNINPALIEKALTAKTKAVIPVHLAGLPADIDTIRGVVSSRGIPIIEDAAHAFQALYRGRRVGSLSDITAFSFYATKTITTGEGGMITTDNDKWAERCRMMSAFGISKDAWKRYTAEGSWGYEILAPGFKYNMPDIAAAMGLAQLGKSEGMHKRRKWIAKQFDAAFTGIPELQIPPQRTDCEHAWHLYMLRLNLDRLTIDRSKFIAELKQRGIGASVHFIPLHIHPYYRDLYGFKPDAFPIAYREYLREISLPIYSRMSDDDVSRVMSVVADIVSQNRR